MIFSKAIIIILCDFIHFFEYIINLLNYKKNLKKYMNEEEKT
jgi:hypothetical protein